MISVKNCSANASPATEPEQLSQDVRSALAGEGASLVGFADLRCLPASARQSLDYAVSVGVALDPAAVAKTLTGMPAREYSDEKVRLNAALNYLTGYGAAFLRAKGYRAVPVQTYVAPDVNPVTICSPFQHKTAATRAGLGWIGKSALLVTPEFGPAIRFSTILTDAPLDCGTPVEASRCGQCNACTDACPAGAITGQLWDLSASRSDVVAGRNRLVDPAACRGQVQSYSRTLGIEPVYARVCDRCIAACPWTKRYVARHCSSK